MHKETKYNDDTSFIKAKKKVVGEAAHTSINYRKWLNYDTF